MQPPGDCWIEQALRRKYTAATNIEKMIFREERKRWWFREKFLTQKARKKDVQALFSVVKMTGRWWFPSGSPMCETQCLQGHGDSVQRW